MQTYKNKHGLSLIEILIAVSIVAVLATITIGIVSHMDNQSNERALTSTFTLLDGALGGYYEYWKSFPDPNMSPYPTSSAALYGQLRSTPGLNDYLEGINDKLIKNNPVAKNNNTVIPEIYDPWGTVLNYKYIQSYTFPKIISAGPDKLFGTSDDIENR